MAGRIVLTLLTLTLMTAISAFGLTAKEVIKLKQNGVSEKTIQMMIESENRAHHQMDSTSGKKMGIKKIVRPDGTGAIIYTTGKKAADEKEKKEMLKEQQAWEMLKSIIIDAR